MNQKYSTKIVEVQYLTVTNLMHEEVLTLTNSCQNLINKISYI